MRGIIRWTILGLFTVLILPVLQEYAVEFARTHHFYDSPSKDVGWLLGYVRMIAQIPYFYYLLVFVGGLTLGLWAETALKRFDQSRPSKADKFRRLGNSCLLLSKLAKEIAGNSWIYGKEYPDLLHRYAVIGHNLDELGIEYPKPDLDKPMDNANAIYQYLSYIGLLLIDRKTEIATRERLDRSLARAQSNRSDIAPMASKH